MTASPDLFSWLRGLRGTADVNGKVFRSVPDPLWPLALDVIEAYERTRTGSLYEYDAAIKQMRVAHRVFLSAALDTIEVAWNEMHAQAVNSLSGTGRYKAEAEAERLRAELAAAHEALRRLASTEGFNGALDAAHAPSDVLWAELRARSEYAQAAARGDAPRGWDETTPPCARCGRIVCMCPTGDETRRADPYYDGGPVTPMSEAEVRERHRRERGDETR